MPASRPARRSRLGFAAALSFRLSALRFPRAPKRGCPARSTTAGEGPALSGTARALPVPRLTTVWASQNAPGSVEIDWTSCEPAVSPPDSHPFLRLREDRPRMTATQGLCSDRFCLLVPAYTGPRRARREDAHGCACGAGGRPRTGRERGLSVARQTDATEASGRAGWLGRPPRIGLPRGRASPKRGGSRPRFRYGAARRPFSSPRGPEQRS